MLTRASILKSVLLLLTITHMMTHIFRRVHIALFPLIRVDFNLSLRQLGVVAAIPPLCQVLVSIPAGLITDRFGAKRMILLSLILSVLGSLMAGLTLNPLMLIIAVSLIYIQTTIYHSSSYTFITKLFDHQEISKAIGIQDIGGNLGTAIGPISVGILMGSFAFGWRQVYLFWLIPILISVIGVINIQHEPSKEAPKQNSNQETSICQSNSMLTTSLVFFLVFLSVRALASQMVGVFLPVYLVDERGLGENLSSLIYGSGALMGIVGAPLGGFLSSSFGEKKWLLVVLSLACIFLGAAINSPNIVFFVILYLLYVFCNTLAMSARSALMARLAPRRRRGLGYSLYFLPSSLMGVVAPLIASNTAEIYGLTSIFFIALIAYGLGLAMLKFAVDVPHARVE